MSKYIDRAKELRAIASPHYNCAQSVLLPFAEELGIPEDLAMRVAANFGGGMKMASVCGAVTGGLMALGLCGMEDPKVLARFYRRVKEQHQGYLNCADLLRINKEAGREKKPHCDDMVYECVALVEEILGEQGKLPG